jgi:hypothetical protein
MNKLDPLHTHTQGQYVDVNLAQFHIYCFNATCVTLSNLVEHCNLLVCLNLMQHLQ